jgi:anti-sigma factor RsiW
MECAEVDVMLQGYLDGELDLAGSLEIERHLSGCQACSQNHQQYRLVRTAINGRVPYFEAPSDLRRRIRSSIRSASRAEKGSFLRRLQWKILWVPAAAAIVVFAALPYLMRPAAESLLAQDIVTAHVRSLMPGHLTDVLSSDQHTVKPWFNGRLDFSPPVKDLAAQGFPLVGGRMDYIGRRPVAALVYQRRKHLINLFVWPSQSGDSGAGPTVTQNGYRVIRWSQSGMTYWAVSDVGEADLREFADRVRN